MIDSLEIFITSSESIMNPTQLLNFHLMRLIFVKNTLILIKEPLMLYIVYFGKEDLFYMHTLLKRIRTIFQLYSPSKHSIFLTYVRILEKEDFLLEVSIQTKMPPCFIARFVLNEYLKSIDSNVPNQVKIWMDSPESIPNPFLSQAVANAIKADDVCSPEADAKKQLQNRLFKY